MAISGKIKTEIQIEQNFLVKCQLNVISDVSGLAPLQVKARSWIELIVSFYIVLKINRYVKMP